MIYFDLKYSLRREWHISKHVQEQPQSVFTGDHLLVGAARLRFGVFLLSFCVRLAIASHVLQESAQYA